MSLTVLRSALQTGVLCLMPLTVARAESQWLRGDLHGHSRHSDGIASVARVLRMAEHVGLDFFALTDHDNKMGGVPHHWDDPEFASERLVLLYGVEWTTPRGHANVWSSERFPYEPFWKANQELDLDGAIMAAERMGLTFSVNHPMAMRKLDWQFPFDARLGLMEVWNSSFLFPTLRNPRALAEVWDPLLAQGRRIVAVGGSDTHMPQGPMAHFFTVGNPTTWVWAHERSGAAVLDGIHSGKVSVSCDPKAPRLELEADGDGDGIFETPMGSAVDTGTAMRKFRVRMTNVASDGSFPFRNGRWEVRLIRNGQLWRQEILRGSTLEFSDAGEEPLVYLRAQLRDLQPLVDGIPHCFHQVALSNPIYGDGK